MANQFKGNSDDDSSDNYDFEAVYSSNDEIGNQDGKGFMRTKKGNRKKLKQRPMNPDEEKTKFRLKKNEEGETERLVLNGEEVGRAGYPGM